MVLAEKFGIADASTGLPGLLGVPTLGDEQLLRALDAAAEAAASPLIFFIDGLNERVPRDAWKRDLASLVRKFNRYPNLRLCMSCRTVYRDDVVPNGLPLPDFEHRGFAGVEFEAVFEFFKHWNLDRPGMPMLQPEFSNPLFLRLLCEALARDDRKSLAQPLSLGELTQLFIDGIERTAESPSRLDVDRRERVVARAVDALVEEMRATGNLRVPWDVAKARLDAILPGRSRSQSLLEFLVREGLLAEVRLPAPAQPRDYVRFAFERLGEFLFVSRGLSETAATADVVARAASAVGATVDDFENVDQGRLEALAILLPERYAVELPDLPAKLSRSAALNAMTRGLPWRAPSTVSDRTRDLIGEALSLPDTFRPALQDVFALIGRSGHPLGIDFVDRLLSRQAPSDRDAVVGWFLHLDWQDRGPTHRLIDWALRSDLGSLTPTVIVDWTRALLWFCLAPDRRVRDAATMGVVNLFERTPDVIAGVLEWGLDLDDEYIVERALLAAYGALVRSRDGPAAGRAAQVVWTRIFASRPPLNAMIRDHARCIVELANTLGSIPSDVDLQKCRPPYVSALPAALKRDTPSPLRQGGYGDTKDVRAEAERVLPRDGDAVRAVRHSVVGDDFAVYTMTGTLQAGDRPLLHFDNAKLWILEETKKLGLGSRADNYDGYMMYTYGGGRGRPDWAERIGKKYQWIALYRVIGLVEDHIPVEGDSRWDRPLPAGLPPALQAARERNLDPTILLRDKKPDADTSWWAPAQVDFRPDLTDQEWMDDPTFADSRALIEVQDPKDGTRWLVLSTYGKWNDRVDKLDYKVKYRDSFMFTWAYLILKARLPAFWKWVSQQNLEGRRVVPEGPDWIPRVFAGEYPWSVQAVRELARINADGIFRDFSYPITPATYDQALEFEFDSYRERTLHMELPAPEFFEGTDLHWNGTDGFATADGSTVFRSPSLVEAGPSSLLVRREWLDQFLRERRFGIVWTVLSEKNVIEPGPNAPVGFAVHSRAYQLRAGNLVGSAGVNVRRPPVNRPRDRPPVAAVGSAEGLRKRQPVRRSPRRASSTPLSPRRTR